MTSAYQLREKYGNPDASFQTPGITTHHGLEIHPNQTYEVTIDGEVVLVLGSNLKSMRSKPGYHRLLYNDKLYVFHTSEIRELDRTENDVITALDGTKRGGETVIEEDTDEDTPPIPPQNIAPTNRSQAYSVKINETWWKLPQSSVVPSRDRPGYYNVTYNGKVFNVSAVNVMPLQDDNTYQASKLIPPPPVSSYQKQQEEKHQKYYQQKPHYQQHHQYQQSPQHPQQPHQEQVNHYNPYQRSYGAAMNPVPPTQNYGPYTGAPQLMNMNMPGTPRSPGIQTSAGQTPGVQTRSQIPNTSGMQTSSQITSYPGMHAAATVQPNTPGRGPVQMARSPGSHQAAVPVPTGVQQVPYGSTPSQPYTENPAFRHQNPYLNPGWSKNHVQPSAGVPPAQYGTVPEATRSEIGVPAGVAGSTMQSESVHALKYASGSQASQRPQSAVSNNTLPVTRASSLAPSRVVHGEANSVLSTHVEHLATAGTQNTVEEEELAESLANVTVNNRRVLRRDSYVVDKTEPSGKVRVFVGGSWQTVDKKTLKPSSKKPGSYILRIDGKSVRLSENHITEYSGEDGSEQELSEATTKEPQQQSTQEQQQEQEQQEKPKPEFYHVFCNGVYTNVSAADVREAVGRVGYKLVTVRGVQQLIHTNFIFPLISTEEGKEPSPLIPDSYRVMLTPEGVVIPKENIKPDSTLPNTFMVLWNNMIYKLGAENLIPIFEPKSGEEATNKANKNQLADTNSGRVQRTRRSSSRADSKMEVSSVPIPRRPKGKFPSKDENSEEEEDETVTKPESTGNNTRSGDMYKVKIKGITIHLPSYRVASAPKRPGFYKVFVDDKWVYVKEEHVTRIDNSISESTVNLKTPPKKEETISRSPFVSPVAWDKRLRNPSKGKPLANRPRWKGTSNRIGQVTRTKKLIYKKMMIPSKTAKGRFHIYGTPGVPCEENSISEFFSTDQDTRHREVSETTQDMDGRVSVGGGSEFGAESIADTATTLATTTTDQESVVDTGKQSLSEKPMISQALYDTRPITTPGIPVLQDTRILSAPGGRVNMDWVKSLRNM